MDILSADIFGGHAVHSSVTCEDYCKSFPPSSDSIMAQFNLPEDQRAECGVVPAELSLELG